MASVSPVNGGQSSDPTSNQNQPSNVAAADPLANQSTFLTLLVSQLKNQNPTSPMDGTTFVTQLAQFSELQQNLAIRQDTDSISKQLTGTSSMTAAAASSDTSANGTTGTTQPDSNS